MATVKVDKGNFQADVLNAKEPVVVDFWAEWCGPCKMIAPALEDIAKELGSKVKVAKLNIDENPELAAQYGVRSIPTLMIFKGGEVADMKVGAAPKTACRTGSMAASPEPIRISERSSPAIAPGFFLGAIADGALALTLRAAISFP
ncbi:thioredoxin [Mesorhizobium sp. M1A.F.Ca.ET.072.01.1.1]|nr:thioredoxin [Mesorhizobium sp. M1A.F.Ca.ET.072.01.1.1]